MLTAVEKYLASDVNTPFFLVLGDDLYLEIKNSFTSGSTGIVNLSEYCGRDDKRPDLDKLANDLSSFEFNHTDNKVLVVGLGEYLALCGETFAYNELLRFKDLNLHQNKAVFLLRSITTIMKKLVEEDRTRFDDRRVCFIGNGISNISINLIKDTSDIPAHIGFKALLAELENGSRGCQSVKTTLEFENSLLNCKTIKGAYDGVKYFEPTFTLPRFIGNDEHWAELLNLLSNAGSLEAVLKNHGLNDNLEACWDKHVHGIGFVNWLYFVSLKLNMNRLSNNYLKFVLESTESFDSFSKSVLNAITELKHTDNRFDKFYAERKMLIEKFSEHEIAEFVANNRKNAVQGIYYLTDTTLSEREEIIACYSKSRANTIYDRAVNIYPLLKQYLRPYIFDCGELSDLLSQYFEDYKKQKLSNIIEPQFDEQVKDLAKQRLYNRLDTRSEVIDRIDKEGAYLYWLDALGVEFLGFIQSKCKDLGLSIDIHVAQAQLPTTTVENRDFYDDWQGACKEHDDRLDKVKHKKGSKYNYQNNKLPIHLAKELDVVEDVLNEVATKLASRQHKKVIIASDHGASRLAVINEQEEKYETETKGENSGRCCQYFQGCDLPYATNSDNGYLVLADYGRFKGSRAANVEVHGGASLEEVLVPVIELKLKDSAIQVELLETTVIANIRTVARLNLFSNYRLNDVSLVVDGKRYEVVKIGENHYSADLPDIKRAGDYYADVYEGDNLVERLKFTIQTGISKKNDSFEDLF